MMKNPSKILNQSGQVAVEYALMLVVIVVLVTSVAGLIKEKIIFDPNRCGTDSINPICALKNLTNADGDGATKFRYFRLRR